MNIYAFSHTGFDCRVLASIEKEIKYFVEKKDFKDLMARVSYVEQKLGIESGK